MLNNQQLLKRWVLILVALTGLLVACQPAPAPETLPDQQQTVNVSNVSYDGKKVFYVDSYHVGYEWSDGIEAGVRSILDGTGVTLETYYMDTKRNTSDAFCWEAGIKAAAAIEAFQPDVVIAADDNAQRCLVVPFLKGTDTPVIFLGVNWDASAYGYSPDQITGMVEVEMIAQLMDHLKQYAKGSRITYITINSETEIKRYNIINKRFFDNRLAISIAPDLKGLKENFLQAQATADIVLLGNNAGALQWDERAAAAFFAENTQVPTGSVYTWFSPYALITLAELPEEEGEWGAQAALQILGGTPVSDIPSVTNKKGEVILNLDIAAQMNLVFAPAILRHAEVYPAQTAGS